MNYALNKPGEEKQKTSFWASLRKLAPLLAGEKRNITVSFIAIIISSVSTLLAPIVISHTVDTYIGSKDFHGVIVFSAVLLGIFITGLGASYVQTITMGGVGRRILFNLRNAIFTKLQSLPVAFFNQNKAGDLISRINNDTDKLNQFFSQALMQFAGSFFLIAGTGILIVILNAGLGLAALIPAFAVFIITQAISPWVRQKNISSLRSLGGMSSEIQESLNNFKVIVAFNRLDYFRKKFNEANQNNFSASVRAGYANNIFIPLYGLASNFAQLIVVFYGTHLIAAGNLSVGLLIGFLLYVNGFYNPLRQIAAVWSSLQLALAAFDRISEVLALESDMPVVSGHKVLPDRSILTFKNVYFRYPDGKEVLHGINFNLEKGKTYALVGPTGGGKTTTASIMARLYDPSEGTVFLDGRDIRSYEPGELAKKIGFILQDPFLFNGTVRDNILYGNADYRDYSNDRLSVELGKAGLGKLLGLFARGLDTVVSTGGGSISLGQKQIIAFIRAILRKPELLILDEATANIDTVTERFLNEIIGKLPKATTKIIIAHRLNTIRSADQIFFVNAGEITLAGSMEHALDMLLHGKRKS